MRDVERSRGLGDVYKRRAAQSAGDEDGVHARGAPAAHQHGSGRIDALFDGKKFRVLTLVDNYSRKSLVLHSGISIKGEDVAEILKNVTFEQQAYPKRIKIDNGPEFISKALDRWAYERKIELEFSRPGKPTDNAFIESFNGSLRDECLNVNWFLSLEDAQQKLDVWKEDYNSYRPHSSLGNLTPKEFIENSQNMQISLF